MAAGNPCAKNVSDEYEAFLLAHLGDQIRWLDYRVVDPEKVAACKEQFQTELELLSSSESIKKAEALQTEKEKLSQAELRKVYLIEAVTLLVLTHLQASLPAYRYIFY
jgi:hypothetical protein